MSAVVEAKDLKIYFDIRKSFYEEVIKGKKSRVKAVDGINLEIARGEIVSLVGESGSGKTTLGKALLSLVEKTEGRILFDGREVHGRKGKDLSEFRQKAQIIYQDPYKSLNPRYLIQDIVAEPLVVNKLVKTASEQRERVIEALTWAGLTPAEDYLHRFPHELSGGQRQRVAIATTLIMKPEFIVADEPVSMLDVSIRADILKLMVGLRDRMAISYLFITHDLSLAWLISDRIAIMYLGKIVEIGPPALIVGDSLHPYTRALIDVMPHVASEGKRKKSILKGETPNPIDLPTGCRFHPRCPVAKDICRQKEPVLRKVKDNHFVSCHFTDGIMEGR